MAMTETRDVGQTPTEKGISLARGPALVLGTILLAAGLYFLYKQHNFPKFSNFPNGNAPVDGKVFGIFGANGWTGMLTAVAGGLLLFGAAQHLVAKTMSLLVGVALGAAAIIAAVSGNVLGLAAANRWTELGWAVVAAILLFNTVIPRRRKTVTVADDEQAVPVTRDTRAARPVAQPVGAGTRVAATGAPVRTETAARAVPARDTRYADEPGTIANDPENGVRPGETRQVESEDAAPGRPI